MTDQNTRTTTEEEVRLCELIRTAPIDSPEAQAAFAELYLRHYDAAMVSAFRLLHNRHRAEETVAEAFTKTLRALREGHGPRESVRGYLLIAVRSEALRSPAIERLIDETQTELLEELPELASEDPVDRFAERDQLVRAFASLPEQHRKVLYLLEVEELPSSVVAARLGMTDQAAWSMAFRAREGLRKAYLQQYVESAGPECVNDAELLAEYVRGGLRKRKRAQVHRHVEQCSACDEQVSRLTRINQGLKAWIGPLILATGLTSAAVGEKTSSAAAAPLGHAVGSVDGRRAAGWLWGGLGAGVAAVAVGALILLNPGPGPLELTARPADQPVASEQNVADDGSAAQTEPGGQSRPQQGSTAIGGPAVEADTAGASAQDPPRPSGDDRTPNWVLVE